MSEEIDCQKLSERLEKLRKLPVPEPPPLLLSNCPIPFQFQFNLLRKFLNLLKTDFHEGSVLISPSTTVKALALLIHGIKNRENEAENIIERFIGKDSVMPDDKNMLMYISLYYSKELELAENVSKDNNGCNLLDVDFKDTIKAAEKINSTVSHPLKERIPAMIDSSFIKINTSLLLGMASSFTDGAYPFKSTEKATFYSKVPRTVTMLCENDGFGWNFREDEEWSCLGIPLWHTSIPSALYILLPKQRNGLNQLIKKFDWNLFVKCTKPCCHLMKAVIPVFEIESKVSLKEELQQMGLSDIFKPNTLDLFFDTKNSDHTLDEVFSSAKINLDQNGIYAEPSIDYGIRCDIAYPSAEFVADHPFIFFIASSAEPSLSSEKINCVTSIHFVGIYK